MSEVRNMTVCSLSLAAAAITLFLSLAAAAAVSFLGHSNIAGLAAAAAAHGHCSLAATQEATDLNYLGALTEHTDFMGYRHSDHSWQPDKTKSRDTSVGLVGQK